jgi:hypothetical protein
MYSTTEELTKSINELQSDILGEKLTNNPLMKASKVQAKNKALTTSQKTIVNAINELVAKITELSSSTSSDLNTMYSVIGAFQENPELKNELTSRQAETILALAAQTYDEVQAIKEIAKDDFEDIFSIPEGEVRSEFKLAHTPLGKIRFYVDGIRYFKDCIEYNAETNTVKWVNDSSKPEGFDITDADVVIEYDYDTREEA